MNRSLSNSFKMIIINNSDITNTRLNTSHGVEGHPPDESLRWDETPLVAVRPTSLQLPTVSRITTASQQSTDAMQCSKSSRGTIDTELLQYSLEKVTEPRARYNLLEWWAEKQTFYPNLAQ